MTTTPHWTGRCSRRRLLSKLLAVSSIGYPDFFKPRDWLAGLGAQQQLFAFNVVGGGVPSLLYTIPAGKTLILTRLYLQLSMCSTAAGIASFISVIDASQGITGSGVVDTLHRIWLVSAVSGSSNDSADIPHPLQIVAAAGVPNLLRQTGAAAGSIGAFDGSVIGYGALLN